MSDYDSSDDYYNSSDDFDDVEDIDDTPGPPPPSEEQLAVIHGIRQGYNAIVSAVAGAGKSTTVFSIATTFRDKNILQITYNSSLKTEVREKAARFGITNIEVHTYHSLCVQYYNKNAHEDMVMRRIVQHNAPPVEKIPDYDIVILDESQDMTPLYYQLVYKMITDCRRTVQLVCLGDVNQGIYEFKGADGRFLTFADRIWAHNPYLLGAPNPIFKEYTLSTSYRVTRPVAWFINDVMLGENRIVSMRDGPQISYIRHHKKINTQRAIIGQLNALLHTGAAKPEDIFVIAPSTKGDKSHIRQLENELVVAGIPCFIPTSETTELDKDITRGKIVFTTFHQSKGRERKVVIVMGFDKSYFTYYNRDTDPAICPSTLYVAVSRSSERLIIVEPAYYDTSRPLPFLKMTHRAMTSSGKLQLHGIPYVEIYESEEEDLEKLAKKHVDNITNIIRFLNEDVMNKMPDWLDELFTIESDPVDEIDIPTTIDTSFGLKEDVSEINGKVIPMLYELGASGNSTIYRKIMEYVEECKESRRHSFLIAAADRIKNDESLADYLYMMNIYFAFQEGLYYKVKQINQKDYDWLDTEIVEKCHANMRNWVGDNCVYEKTIVNSGDIDEKYNYLDNFVLEHLGENVGVIRLTGRVDAYDKEAHTVWEFKCVKEITMEHKIQVIMYAWLWSMIYYDEPMPEFKILNIRNGNVVKLNISATIDLVAIEILKNKFAKNKKMSDEEFLEEFAM